MVLLKRSRNGEIYGKNDINIERVNDYSDSRFRQNVLQQHGAFLVNEVLPYEVEILNQTDAVIHGEEKQFFENVVEEFRFYAGHISRFFDEDGQLLFAFEPVRLIHLPLTSIQPSQFYVDKSKLAAVKSFIQSAEDIVIPVAKMNDTYVSLDGHTRLAVAVNQSFAEVYVYMTESDDYIHDFVAEARKRGIVSPMDLIQLEHQEYQEKWLGFCKDYFAKH